MEASESQVPKDLDHQITETVLIPQVPGEFLHISTSQEQMGNFFEEYATLLGFDGNASREYLQNNVDVTFLPIPPSSRNIPQTKPEFLIDEISSRIFRKGPFGETARLKNNRVAVSIDTQNIVRLLPNYRLAKSFPKYSDLSNEGKIATLEATVMLAIMHELRHVLQFMSEPEKIDEHLKRAVSMRRALFGAISAPVLTLPVASSSEMAFLTAVGINLAAISHISIKTIQYNRKPLNIENDAYHGTENPNLIKMNHRPFNFDIEVDPQIPASLKKLD